MRHKLLGHVLNPTCVVIRMSGSKRQAGSRWRAVGVSEEQQGRLVELSQHKNGDFETVFCRQAQVISCKKSIFFDSVSVSCTSFSEI